ncbi:MAG: hypothetical protein IJA10_10850 [Lachnospiraceae bacterium]|nr:hypothetical protein [Lachnospiraceae bacterium]
MLPVQFVYTENGVKKSSLDEHKRRVEILEHNKRLHEECFGKKKTEKSIK